jgi:hypothetical protein
MSTADVYVLGYCEDTRVLLDLMLAEAPAMLSRLVIVEPDEKIVRALAGRGFCVRQASLEDPAAIGATMRDARLVVCFAPERMGRSPDVLEALLRMFVPDASLYIHGATSTLSGMAGAPSDDAGLACLVARITSWRLWLLVGVTALDAAVFFLPVTSAALLGAALLAPRRLQQAARFLDALATGRGT